VRNARDPRRIRSHVKLILEKVPERDSYGDAIGDPEYEVIWEGKANIQPWLPRYNIPTAPVTGGVMERRIAARVYLPANVPWHIEGLKVLDVKKQVVYALITDGLDQAGTETTLRFDLGAPRVSGGID